LLKTIDESTHEIKGVGKVNVIVPEGTMKTIHHVLLLKCHDFKAIVFGHKRKMSIMYKCIEFMMLLHFLSYPY
jgi:hypothetical protein